MQFPKHCCSRFVRLAGCECLKRFAVSVHYGKLPALCGAVVIIIMMLLLNRKTDVLRKVLRTPD